MKYDDASWHYGGNYPSDLPSEDGATHIAMFFAWAAENDLLSDIHKTEYAQDLNALKHRNRNYRDYFLSVCDEKLTNDDLNQIGNAFAVSYYEKGYYGDYEITFENDGETIYHVRPTWENYDRLRPVLQDQFNSWLRRQV